MLWQVKALRLRHEAAFRTIATLKIYMVRNVTTTESRRALPSIFFLRALCLHQVSLPYRARLPLDEVCCCHRSDSQRIGLSAANFQCWGTRYPRVLSGNPEPDPRLYVRLIL